MLWLVGALLVAVVVQAYLLLRRKPEIEWIPRPVPKFRVLRYQDGRLVESLAQGEGGYCRRVYESYEPETTGEEIRFYRGDEPCSAKTKDK